MDSAAEDCTLEAEARERHAPRLLGKYIFSRDHKVIGVQFLFTSLLLLVFGGLFALALRWRLSWPTEEVPVLGAVTSVGYSVLFTLHGSVMVFFVVIPFLIGAFGNFVLPLHIGARETAFPLLGGLSYWIFPAAGILLFSGLLAEGGAASAGWTSYTPLSTGSGAGQTCWIVSLLVVGASLAMAAVNHIVTVVKCRAPGMTFSRLSLTVWAVFITAILVCFATPVLTVALVLLLLDQAAGTTFFSQEPLLWQQLFWLYPFPIAILIAMGISSDVISVFARKPVFGYKTMACAMAGIGGLGFVVWGQHMYVSGMSPALGSTFMVASLLMTVPSAIKVVGWIGTLWGGNIQLTPPMLFALGFVSMFLIGVLSGVFLAVPAVNIQLHDTYFVVAHLHYVLVGGSLFGIFAGVYFWFPKMFGRAMSETWGMLHFLLTFITFNCTFFAMHILGAAGMPRRHPAFALEPGTTEQWRSFQPYQDFLTISALGFALAQVPFFVNFFWSLAKGKKAEKNPWKANTLEWTLPSPPARGNFSPLPEVYRGPYEYSSPWVEEDYLPQSRKLEGEAAAKEMELQSSR